MLHGKGHARGHYEDDVDLRPLALRACASPDARASEVAGLYDQAQDRGSLRLRLSGGWSNAYIKSGDVRLPQWSAAARRGSPRGPGFQNQGGQDASDLTCAATRRVGATRHRLAGEAARAPCTEA